MSEQDDLLAELPAPNPDEPVSLRRDIADELRDHLECAASREALTHQDPHEIERRVLARFGNPKKIALRLWLDWMKEKLMMQKITLVLVSLVAVVSLAACGLMWSLAQDFQAASAELLTQGRDANHQLLNQNQEMMAKLTALANRKPEPAPSLDWNPLKIRVVKDDGKKTPAEGIPVVVSGPLVAESEKTGTIRTTDENGLADFGMVRPGTFDAEIRTPWGEKHRLGIMVQPGQAAERKIIMPLGPPEPIQVKPVVNWPKVLDGLDVAVLIEVSRDDIREIDGKPWTGGGDRSLLIRPDGGFAVYHDTTHLPSRYSPSNYPNEQIADTVRFNDDPQIFTETFPWTWRAVQKDFYSVVYLPKEETFPAKGASLKCLSPSQHLDRSWQSQFNFVKRNRGKDGELFEAKTLENGSQEWFIELAPADVFATRAMIAPEQFPKLPAPLIIAGALHFVAYDKDQNGEVTEAEWSERNPRLGHPLFEEFPISRKSYIEAFVETRKGRSPRG